MKFDYLFRINASDVISKVGRNWLIVLLLGVLMCVFIMNSFWTFYPDEYVKIVGGNYINHGMLPYRDFFSNHGPFGYFFAAIITFFSGDSFVGFRTGLGLVYFVLSGMFFVYLVKRFGKKEGYIYLAYLLFYSIGQTYNWSHMLLADTLAGFLLLPAYILLFLIIWRRLSLRWSDVAVISLLSGLVFFTSLAYIYAILVIYFVMTFYFFRSNNFRFGKYFYLYAGILLIPYLFFGAYFLITNSWNDYFYQTVSLMREFYLGGDSGHSSSNPIRVGLTIFSNFLENFMAVLGLVKDLSFGNPFSHSLALASFSLLIILFFERKFLLFVLSLGLLVFVCGRANPYLTKETDYQAVIYHMLGLFNGVFALQFVWRRINEGRYNARNVIYAFILLLLGLYFVFLGLFLFKNAYSKWYGQYMGELPLIYDRPSIAHLLNSLLREDEYFYVGPFYPEEVLYLKSKLSSRWYFLIPPMDKSPVIQQGLLEDLDSNKPKIVVYNTGQFIYGLLPGEYVVDYLADNYLSINDLLSSGDINSVLSDSEYGNFSFVNHFFVRKQDKDEIVMRMKQMGLVD